VAHSSQVPVPIFPYHAAVCFDPDDEARSTTVARIPRSRRFSRRGHGTSYCKVKRRRSPDGCGWQGTVRHGKADDCRPKRDVGWNANGNGNGNGNRNRMMMMMGSTGFVPLDAGCSPRKAGVFWVWKPVPSEGTSQG
jgi:hypothetical protein